MQSLEEKLFSAASRGDVDELDSLLASNASDQAQLLALRRATDGWSMLHVAAHLGRITFMKRLIEHYRVDPNGPKTNMGGIALHKAAVGGQLHSLEYLIGAGSLPDSTNERNWTPFLECAIHGHLECAKYLLEKGARMNIQDVYGKSSLHYAAQNGNAPYVEWLLKNGADASLVTKKGDTALSFAEAKADSNSQFDSVKSLLTSGIKSH